MHDIHVRLRPGKDDDLARWYTGLEHKSSTVREALRQQMAAQGTRDGARCMAARDAQWVAEITDAVLGKLLAGMAGVVESAVAEAVAGELDDLPARVSAAVCEMLARRGEDDLPSVESEDPRLASRLDEQLDTFFND